MLEIFGGANRATEVTGPLGRVVSAEWRLDGGTNVYLSFVDLSARTVHPDRDAITARLTCFNGDLPSRLPFGDDTGDFELETGGPIRRRNGST